MSTQPSWLDALADSTPTATQSRSEDAELLFKAGLRYLEKHQLKKAKAAFKRAHELRPRDSRYMSYLGLCLAQVDREMWDAMKLCKQAIKAESYRPELFLNLGRVYLLCGDRWNAHAAFDRGLGVDDEHPELGREIAMMGVRKPPPVRFLDRKHPINRFAGKMLARFGVR